MPLISTRGAASAQGFGEFAQSAAVNYIEDVFSTYLYTGNGSSQTITNGIDLSGKGGLVWVKQRNSSSQHILNSTGMNTAEYLRSNDVGYYGGVTTTFNANGFTTSVSVSPETYVSWTFRNQAKFFDVVTWTGNGSNRTISHNLGSVPGCIIVKRLGTADWQVYHRSLANTEYLVLNSTAAKATGTTRWNSTTPTSTVFSLGTDTTVNASGGTYVAYLFAHDAGGFGLSGTDNVISCGSFTTDGSGNATVTLGYEPQWAMVKISSGTGDWLLKDNMRGTPVGTAGPVLYPNLSSAEANFQTFSPNATGFTISGLGGSSTYIYIAIRRGPMKVPTSGTSVFNTIVRAGTAANATVSGVGFSPDLAVVKGKTSGDQVAWNDRLRGTLLELMSSNTNAEISTTDTILNFTMDGASLGADATRFDYNATGHTYANWFFRRAPSFFDVVCYTGTGVARTINHNLAAVPELMIVRRRSSIANWAVNSQSLTASDYLYLNSTDPKANSTSPIIWNSTRPTSTVFSVGTSNLTNENAQTFVAYLFATVAGVSKVGSYTGSGTTKQIDCGFTAGARFVLIKRTDSTGNWLVADSARGIVAGNDPLLYLNSTAAEITTLDWIDADSSGFIVNQEATANANVSSATYIYFAVA